MTLELLHQNAELLKLLSKNKKYERKRKIYRIIDRFHTVYP